MKPPRTDPMAKAGRKAKRQTRAGGTSFARLTPYLRGIICGLMLAGYSVGDIVEGVAKRDGSQPSPTAVRQSLEVPREMGGMAWDGVAETGAGRPKKTTDAHLNLSRSRSISLALCLSRSLSLIPHCYLARSRSRSLSLALFLSPLSLSRSVALSCCYTR